MSASTPAAPDGGPAEPRGRTRASQRGRASRAQPASAWRLARPPYSPRPAAPVQPAQILGRPGHAAPCRPPRERRRSFKACSVAGSLGVPRPGARQLRERLRGHPGRAWPLGEQRRSRYATGVGSGETGRGLLPAPEPGLWEVPLSLKSRLRPGAAVSAGFDQLHARRAWLCSTTGNQRGTGTLKISYLQFPKCQISLELKKGFCNSVNGKFNLSRCAAVEHA